MYKANSLPKYQQHDQQHLKNILQMLNDFLHFYILKSQYYSVMSIQFVWFWHHSFSFIVQTCVEAAYSQQYVKPAHYQRANVFLHIRTWQSDAGTADINNKEVEQEQSSSCQCANWG